MNRLIWCSPITEWELNGVELLQQIKRQLPDITVILMTAYGTIENAVTAMKAGAYDYLTKPFSLEQVQHVVERALEIRKLRAENRTLRDTLEERPLLESKSTAMRRLLDTARQAARSEATILLTGESGTGKNLLARQMHHWSPRRDHSFVVVNCTTLSEHLLESELFGHVRGAFTGAIKDKPGRLEAADRGTVFLDEIGDLSPALQTKFLRFWMFQVKGFKVCALNESSELLPEPENGQRVSGFAFGPCGAMPPECSWSSYEIASAAQRGTVTGPSLGGGLEQSRRFKSVGSLKPKVVHLTSRIQPSPKSKRTRWLFFAEVVIGNSSELF
jgi:hypothetical protein